MRTSSPVLDIDDLHDDTDLSDEELADIAGGARTVTIVSGGLVIRITIREACSSAVGGGYDYD